MDSRRLLTLDENSEAHIQLSGVETLREGPTRRERMKTIEINSGIRGDRNCKSLDRKGFLHKKWYFSRRPTMCENSLCRIVLELSHAPAPTGDFLLYPRLA